MERLPNQAPRDRAMASASCTQQMFRKMNGIRSKQDVNNDQNPAHVQRPSSRRLAESLAETPYDLHGYVQDASSKRGTVLYLAYGSNLSNETFRGNRGIKPISQINVQVPSLRMTFDLPGIAYSEPCFANSASRDPSNDPPTHDVANSLNNEKTPLLGNQSTENDGYRKNRWHKGLIGVVYEVTAQDYAHIIATEGGGSSYQDVLVDCHPFASSDPKAPVPQNPTLPPFKAHTLFAPANDPDQPPPGDGGRFHRPDSNYAQPSARYLKLITDGAEELGLPYEYQDYLHSIHPYTMTTSKQRVGQFVFLTLWLPIIAFIFIGGRLFVDKKGQLPQWMKEFSGAVFRASWGSYDGWFKPMFGDGERSITDGGDDAESSKAKQKSNMRNGNSDERDCRDVDLEKADVVYK